MAEPTLQQNAYRLGTLDERVVLAGRALTVALIGVAVLLGLRATRRHTTTAPAAPQLDADVDAAAPVDATEPDVDPSS